MPNLPSGTVTFLFTDIEGSTRRWENHPNEMEQDLRRHDQLLRGAIEKHGGHVFKTVGDSFCAAFSTGSAALQAALEAQIAVQKTPWQTPDGIKVRMALHVGEVEERSEDYFGSTVNRVARLLSAGHGSQVLLSAAVREIARGVMPEAATLHSLGTYRLKDLSGRQEIF